MSLQWRIDNVWKLGSNYRNGQVVASSHTSMSRPVTECEINTLTLLRLFEVNRQNNREISVRVDSLVLASCLRLLHINHTSAEHTLTSSSESQSSCDLSWPVALPQGGFHTCPFSLRSTCEISSLQYHRTTAVRWSLEMLERSICTSKSAFVVRQPHERHVTVLC